MYYSEAKSIFRKASMNLREWYSNDSKLMAAIPEADRGGHGTTKVLGLQWVLAADTLSCPKISLIDSEVVTKRFVLHTIAKIYDPCGYFTPVTSPGKWLMQELWHRKYDWDDPISDDLLQQWRCVLASLQKLHECEIPRCYGKAVSDGAVIELHAFCDASAKAYCAAIYMIVKSGEGLHATFLFSKCRVSPLKKQSIPRLELLAATVGTRLLEFVASELRLPISAKYLWSDSQCVLHWILGKPVSTIFVKNRVAEIKSFVGIKFRYIPTSDNPSDLPTRGLGWMNCRKAICGGTVQSGC